MKQRNILGLMLFVGMTSTASAGLVISDHFTDGNLDPNWQVSFENASGWTHTESGTLLTVTDINSSTHDSGSGGNYATTTLSQSFTATSGFQVGFGLSWDSENDNRAMQKVGVRLLDSTGDTVASVFYRDAWISERGEQVATIGNTEVFSSGYSSLAFDGDALINIERTGEAIDIYWDSINILSGTNSSEITGVALDYEFYSYIASGPSFFGTESIDFIQVSNVPVPAAAWLLGSGLVGLIGFRRNLSKVSILKA